VEYHWQIAKIKYFYLEILHLSSEGQEGEKSMSRSKIDFARSKIDFSRSKIDFS